MVNGVKETFDVKIKHPGILPAALSRQSHSLMRRPARSVTKGIGMEVRFECRLQTLLNHHLSHTVGNRWNSQRPHTPIRLRDLHSFNRRRLVTPRSQSIPELVEIGSQPQLELLDRLSVDSSGAPVGLDLLVGFPDFAFGNIKRFGLPSQILPLPVVWLNRPGNATPSVQLHYRAFTPTTSDSAPVPRIGTLALAGATCLSFSLRIAATGSYVPHRSLCWRHATFMPDARQPISRHRLSLSRSIHTLRFWRRHGVSTRHQWFTCVRLTSTHLTELISAFSSTLTTRTLDPRSLR